LAVPNQIITPEIEITAVAASSFTSGTVAGDYWTVIAKDGITFYIWYDVTDSGGNTDPTPVGFANGIKVDILAADDANAVASKTDAALTGNATFQTKFTNSVSLAIVTVVQTSSGTDFTEPNISNSPLTATFPKNIDFTYEVSLEFIKRYHLHLTKTSTSSNLFIATDGTSPPTPGNKWYRQFFSPTFTPIPIELSDSNWDDVKLPNDLYVAIDLTRGRYKFDPAAPLTLTPPLNLTGDYNFLVIFGQLTTEAIVRPDGTSLEEALNDIALQAETFVGLELDELRADLSTTTSTGVVGPYDVVIYPVTGTPTTFMQFIARKPGKDEFSDIKFAFNHAMDSSDTGIVKLDAEIFVNNVSIATRSDIIDPPDDTSRNRFETSGIFIDFTEYVEGDDILIKLSRDNTVGSNHTGKLQLFGITIF